MVKDLQWFAESIADEVVGLGEPRGPEYVLYFEVVRPEYIYARINDSEPAFILRVNRTRVIVHSDGEKTKVERRALDVATELVRVYRAHEVAAVASITGS